MNQTDTIKLPSYLNLARKMAMTSNGSYKLGSCVIKSGRVMSLGFNKYWQSNALAREFFKFETVHAEMDSLVKMTREAIRGVTLYVARIRKDGSYGNSKPCPRCQNALRTLGVRKIVYSIDVYPFFETQKIN